MSALAIAVPIDHSAASRLANRLVRTLGREMAHRAVDTMLSQFTVVELAALSAHWPTWARSKQLAPTWDHWQSWGFLAGRMFGKLLDVETPIPVPLGSPARQYRPGWARMGDLKIGDVVYDESGRPTTVTGAYAVETPTECYRMRFSDGTFVDAADTHQWVTWTMQERKAFLRTPHEDTASVPPDWPSWRLKKSRGHPKQSPRVYEDSPGPRIRTTKEILQTLTLGKRDDWNHSIPTCGPLYEVDDALPVDPYILGVWLGDGTSSAPSITSADAELFKHFETAGHTVSAPRPCNSGKAKLYAIDAGKKGRPGTLLHGLRKLGVFKNKHVPTVYLRGSEGTRLALLQGLLDTDGTISARGHVEFTSTKESLALAVLELARTLGQKACLSVGDAMLSGRRTGPKYRVTWTPTIPVFRLRRKAARLEPRGSTHRASHRMIVSVERIASIPMRCISVDSKHRMYLAGEGMIPTHNTYAGSKFVNDEVDAGRAKSIGLAAQDEANTVALQVTGPSGLIATAPPWNKPRWIASALELHWPNGAIARVRTPEVPGKIRGFDYDLAWLIELQSWPAATRDEAWKAFEFAIRLGYARTVWDATAKKGHPFLRARLAESQNDPNRYVVVRGASRENAWNVGKGVVERLEAKHAGTRGGREELYGDMGEDDEDDDGPLVNASWIDSNRRPRPARVRRRLISVDPAVTSRKGSDDTGIIDAGLDADDGQMLVFGNHSGKYPVDKWADKVLDLYIAGGCDCVVAETNKGGDLVTRNLRIAAEARDYVVEVLEKGKKPRGQRGVVYIREVYARGEKADRARPIGSAYKHGRVSHVDGAPGLAALETTLTTWEPGPGTRSPGDLDALAHAGGELLDLDDSKPDPKRAFEGFNEAARAVSNHRPVVANLPVLFGGSGRRNRL